MSNMSEINCAKEGGQLRDIGRHFNALMRFGEGS